MLNDDYLFLCVSEYENISQPVYLFSLSLSILFFLFFIYWGGDNIFYIFVAVFCFSSFTVSSFLPLQECCYLIMHLFNCFFFKFYFALFRYLARKHFIYFPLRVSVACHHLVFLSSSLFMLKWHPFRSNLI